MAENETVEISDDRWILPNGTLVSKNEPFVLNDMQHLNGVAGLSEEQIVERGIVKMSSRPDDKYASSVVPDQENLGEWIVVPISAEETKSLLKQFAAKKRWEKETGGIVVGQETYYDEERGLNTSVGGVRVSTDSVAQQKIGELRRRSESGEISMPFDFKGVDGWFSLDLQTIVAVDMAVSAHVQACYALEKSISERIDSGELTTEEQVTTAFNAA